MFKIVIKMLIWSFGLFLFIGQSLAQAENTSEAKAITIQLLSDKVEIALGNESASGDGPLIGVQIEAEAGWHFYWAGIGTELLEPTLSWNLPEGYRVEAVNHPEPRLFDYGGFMGYGYDGQTVFLYRLIRDKESPIEYVLGEALEVSAKIDWILCKDVCIFGSESVSLEWRVSEVDKATG